MKVIVVHKAEDVPLQPVDGKPTLVYWNILGLASPIRLALVQAGVDFVDVRIDAGDVTDDSQYKKAWMEAKPGLSSILTFPNLPYFLDDQVSLTQSDTILRYVGRRYGIPDPEPHITDLILDELSDQTGTFVRIAYGQPTEAMVTWYQTTVPMILSRFEQLRAGKEYFVSSDQPGIADFKFYEFLYKIRVVQAELIKDDAPPHLTAELESYMKRMEEWPRVKIYMSSPDYMRRPLNNPTAKFNN